MAVPYLEFRVDYNPGPQTKLLFKEDMEYLRQKILTNRSERDAVSTYESHFYEGAKALIDLLEYTAPDKKMELSSVDICIDPSPAEGKSRLVALWRTGKLDITIQIEYGYTGKMSEDGKIEDAEYYIKARTTGDIIISKDIYCCPAKCIVKYSQNFPTPSAYAAMLDKGLKEMFKELNKKKVGEG